MTNCLNRVTLIGNLGQNPEFRITNDGKEIAHFSLATSETWKDRSSGEKKEKTEWHKIVVLNDYLVKLIKDYVKKGSRVYVEGSMQTRKWTDNHGHEKLTTEVVLQNFNAALILMDTKGSMNDHGNADAGFEHENNNQNS